MCSFASETNRTLHMSRSTKTGRSSYQLPLHHYFSGRLARCVSAASLSALLQCPAFLSSCTQEDVLQQYTEITMDWSTKGAAPEAIDLFFFDTPPGEELLDSYQQLILPQNKSFGISGSGAKRLVALSGKAGEKGRWTQIRTYGNLCKHTFSLERESSSAPLLCGESLLPAGSSRRAQIQLRPMLTAIRLRSVSCDFSGRPYAQSRFVNTQTFLSYAGSEYRPLGEGGGEPVSWLNPGSLDTLAVQALPEPEMLWQKGIGEVGRTRLYPNQTFYCYPGAPTQLVLEGRVGDKPCFYPIPLPSLAPDTRVDLDITLRRMGSTAPDIPTESGAVILELRCLPWEEGNTQIELFG